jgi:FMN phosphatase YigB (HAD superfamily)
MKNQINKISFDCWSTLFYANKNFKPVKCEIIRNHFGTSFTDEQILDGYVKADEILDTYQELGYQPNFLQSWTTVLVSIGIKDFNRYDLARFIVDYDDAFQMIPPKINRNAEQVITTLINSRIETPVICNTILIRGKVLESIFRKFDFFANTRLYFSDEWYAKPDLTAFKLYQGNPDLHVGDNIKSDGACTQLGIGFIQVNPKEENDLLKVLEYV